MSKRKTINNRFCEAKSAEYEKTEQVYLAKVCDIRTDGIEKNLQGDVVAVYNDLGQLLISYKYTAYGEFWMSASNNGFNTKAASNPFTYRGYYFDSDLNLYYLDSRYYDYNTCRFINADKVMAGAGGSLSGSNLFAYCFNDPINSVDGEGTWPKWMKKAAKAIVKVAEKVVVAAFESVEAQVGIGFGTRVNVSGVTAVETARDTYVGIDDGKLITGTLLSATMSVGDASLSVSCDHLSEKGGESVTSSGSPSDNFLDMLSYSDAQYVVESSYGLWSLNSNGDLRFGPQKSYHQGAGGFYSFKFNITEFLIRVFE